MDMKNMDHEHMDMSHGEMNHDHMDHGNMEHMNMDHMHMGHDMGGMDMGHGHMMNMNDFKRRFWISLALAIPILLLSPFMGIVLPFQITFPGSSWIVLILSSILFFFGGQPFFSGAKSEMSSKEPAMMTLITMGIGVAYFYSIYSFVMNTFINPDGMVMNFFWELASLIVIMLLGHWIEMNAVMNAGSAVSKMTALLPNEAHLVQEDGSVTDVAINELSAGQVVLVQAGEKIPTDGVVKSGSSAVNESLVTGESKAVAKKAGNQVIGGSVNGDGTLNVEISAIGEDGYLAQVIKLVSEAQKEKSKAETLADKVSRQLFYSALVIGILALIIWTAVTGFSYGVQRMVTVLVIACPHALGLAIPLVVARSTSIGAQNGLLVRNRQAIESVKKLSYVFMDKTGTLTEGVFNVNALETTSDLNKNELLQIFADLEVNSSHPLAMGIINEAKRLGLTPNKGSEVKAIKGVGLQGQVSGKDYQIVSANYLDKKAISYDQNRFNELASAGNSVSYLISNNQVLGLIAQGDVIRPESKDLINSLRAMGITPVMLTGDNDLAAQKIAKLLGNIEYRSQLLPGEKEAIIKDYQNKGQVVMMVGDGINDAPSLSRANVGVAIGAGTDVAIDSADVILVKSNPEDIVEFINLARATNKKMVQNLWWGAGYNIVAMPLAAGLLAPIGLVLSPAVGAIIMSFSTVIVAINALTLHLKRK